MYFRREESQMPSTTVLQVTGQLTLHHQPHQLPHMFYPKQKPILAQHRQLPRQHTFPAHPSNRQNQPQQLQEFAFRKEAKDPHQAQCYQQTHQTKQNRATGVWKDAQQRKEQQPEEMGRKKQQVSKPQRPFRQQDYQSARLAFLEPLKQLSSRLLKMEEVWEQNISGLNFQTLYQMRKIREHLELQGQRLFCELDEQLFPLQKLSQKWEEQIESERKKLLKEKEEWKEEKEQLVKELKEMMQVMLEEEQKQAQKMGKEKVFEMTEMMERELRRGKADLMGEVEKTGERLNLVVQNISRTSEDLERELEIVNNRVHELKETAPLAQKTQKTHSSIQKDTPYAKNYKIEKNTITLEGIVYRGNGSQYQMVLFDTVIGEEVFSFCTHIKRLNNLYRDIHIGVTDRTTQWNKQIPSCVHSVFYDGACGHIQFGTKDGQDNYASKLTSDYLTEGMKVVVKVDRKNCTVTFILEGDSFKSVYDAYGNEKLEEQPITGRREYKVISPILNEPNRQFVPFFDLAQQGDSLTWEIL